MNKRNQASNWRRTFFQNLQRTKLDLGGGREKKGILASCVWLANISGKKTEDEKKRQNEVYLRKKKEEV